MRQTEKETNDVVEKRHRSLLASSLTCDKSSTPAPHLHKSRTIQRKDGEERMLGYLLEEPPGPDWLVKFVFQTIFHPESNCFLWPFDVTGPVVHFSWVGSSPGCSSRCSGSRNSHIVVADKNKPDTSVIRGK